jgi:hypothetical protein
MFRKGHISATALVKFDCSSQWVDEKYRLILAKELQPPQDASIPAGSRLLNVPFHKVSPMSAVWTKITSLNCPHFPPKIANFGLKDFILKENA